MNSRNNTEYRFAIEYYIFREGENLIAYCPSLDISTSGKDYGDAVKNFYERFQIYVETCLEMGTLWDDLKDHGWKVTDKKLTCFRRMWSPSRSLSSATLSVTLT